MAALPAPAPPEAAPGTGTEPAAHDGHRRGRWLVWASLTAAVVPVVVAAVRALARGWYPLGDNAFFSLRARDVLTEHHPLLGTWTSASLSGETDVNNPGPLLFDLLALPAKVDHVNGVLVGAALLNVAAIVGVVLAARRRGTAAGVTAGVAAAALVWAMGSELVIEPWQPHSLLLPFLLYLVLVWGIAVGDAPLLPWAAGVGSLLVQTHLSYALLVPALAALALGGLWLTARTARSSPAATADGAAAGSTGPPRWRRPVAVAALVGVLAWAQPLLDQVAGEGNLGDLLASTTEDGDAASIGPVLGSRLLATVVASPPWWARPSFEDSFVPEPLQAPGPPDDPARELVGVPSTAGALAGLALLLAALGASAWWARRGGDRGALGALAVTGAALAVGLVTTAILPVGPLGIGPHQLRWLWPLAVFATASVALAAVPARRLAPAGAAVAVVLGVAALPTHAPATGPTADAHAIDVLRALTPQLDRLDRDQVLLVDLEQLRLFEPYSTPVMLELAARGIDFEVDHRFTVRQVGTSRRASGRAEARIWVVEGPAALEVPAGAERVALVRGLDEAERAELRRLEQEVGAHVAGAGLSLSADGRRALDLGLLPRLEAQRGAGSLDPGPLVLSGELGTMVSHGYLELGEDAAATFGRWVELRRRWHRDTVAVLLAPIGVPVP